MLSCTYISVFQKICNERRRSAMRGLATRYRETLVVRATRRTATRMFSKHDTQVGRYKIGRKSNSTRYEGRHSSLDRPLRCFLHPSNSTRPPRRRWHRSSYREASDHDDGDRERGKNHARVNQSPVVCILRSCGKGDDETTSGCGPCSVPRKEKERERRRKADEPVAAEFKQVFACERDPVNADD